MWRAVQCIDSLLKAGLYCKSSIKLPGAYLIPDTPEGGLLEKGALFTKSNDMNTNGAFQFFHSKFVDLTYNFTSQ